MKRNLSGLADSKTCVMNFWVKH
ncbi:hypothetical protein E2C01_003230 [Portunus trituberculatus]|uniref:Uncharacterized protein n=1 Tax=Portunus trituberculatus TaxID=210409 RepID=A0A5B7CSZ9_PORTR|nr:hypothetical protein [Portunus trituberculatus]